MKSLRLFRPLHQAIFVAVCACAMFSAFAADSATKAEADFWKSVKQSEATAALSGDTPVANTPKEKLTQVERDFWTATRDTKNVDDLKAYLQSFPNGAFASLARARIDQLTRERAATPGKPQPAMAPLAPVNDERISPEVKTLMAEIKVLRGMIEDMQRSRQPPAVAPPLARRLTGRALVIGNGAYLNLGKLANPRNDAEAMATKLKSFGMEVELLLDADRDSMARALSEHGRIAVTNDISILYYAGHAVQLDGENYLLPVNARSENATPGYIKLIGVPMAAAIENLPTKTRLVFLDACRDNPLSRSVVSTRTTLPKGLAPAESISGTLIAFATKDGSTAEDGSGSHSPYTAALLRFLDNKEDIGIILRRVRESVMTTTRDRQQPWEYGSLIGEQLVLATMFR